MKLLTPEQIAEIRDDYKNGVRYNEHQSIPNLLDHITVMEVEKARLWERISEQEIPDHPDGCQCYPCIDRALLSKQEPES